MLTFNLKATVFTVKMLNEIYCCRIYFCQLHSQCPYNKKVREQYTVAQRYGLYAVISHVTIIADSALCFNAILGVILGVINGALFLSNRTSWTTLEINFIFPHVLFSVSNCLRLV